MGHVESNKNAAGYGTGASIETLKRELANLRFVVVDGYFNTIATDRGAHCHRHATNFSFWHIFTVLDVGK